MPRLRLLIALCAVASLLAPAAASAVVGLHLEWAGHHGHDPHHQHPMGDVAPGESIGCRESHDHEMPTVDPTPAAVRERIAGPHGPEPGAERSAVGSTLLAGGCSQDRSRPPDRSPGARPGAERIHLHCALLL